MKTPPPSPPTPSLPLPEKQNYYCGSRTRESGALEPGDNCRENGSRNCHINPSDGCPLKKAIFSYINAPVILAFLEVKIIKNTLEQCSICAKPIMERILRATGKAYHPHCFTCVICQRSLDGIPFTVDAGGNIHCIEDFHRKFAPRCSVCKEPIMPAQGQEETVRIVALDRDFHVQCYRCEDCGGLLSEGDNQGCYPLDGHILCKTCNSARIQALTAKASTDL
ncbi:hypothetical protein JD844_007815 [Phrynosoma platyrhinos]|uniref:LIM zinc-binding domain-containing protein n=1 Tax=Phrynosoma platyrhinos TaxID=52577 RepID=A0ABQ7T3L2_PHRPL|nr:hypothetical protein JD844_007815 [Phrynosoma platyrhinos]